MLGFRGDDISIVEINTILSQVDLQNIFDDWSKKQEISISVVVRPTSPTSSFFNVYNRMTGEWLHYGGMHSCLQYILEDYGIRHFNGY